MQRHGGMGLLRSALACGRQWQTSGCSAAALRCSPHAAMPGYSRGASSRSSQFVPCAMAAGEAFTITTPLYYVNAGACMHGDRTHVHGTLPACA
jgi:hypothetical protein